MAVRYGLAASFIAIIIATFTECMPTSNYWQVTPDPGPKCRQAFAQLIVLTFLDIFTDLALVVFPMTIVIASKMPKMRKLSLCALFSLSVVPVGIALYRIDGTIKKHGQQEFRSLLASIEILAATSVANAVVLGSFVRDRGVKKQRWKLPSTSATSTLDRPSIAKARRPRPTVHSWGSDYDLVGDLGLRLGPEFSKRRSTVVRPAPVVLPLTSPSSNDQSVSNWPLVGRNDSVSTDNEDAKNARLTEEMPDSPSMSRPVSLIDVGGLLPPDISSPRSMNFFDVGGLLEENLAAGNPGFRPLVPPKDGQSSRSHSPFRPLQSLFVPGQGEPAPSFHSASTQSARAPGGGIAHIISDAGRLPGPQHSPARHVRIDNDDDDDQPISPLGTETESRGRSRYER
ncbi:hypothetical protein MMC25_004298 [Agyrium rufum]|nr:hypothetical protein [Agyrium rufum]